MSQKAARKTLFSGFARGGRFRPRVLALLAALALAGCIEWASLIDRSRVPDIAGIPSGGNWFGLPLAPWIAEGDIRLEAVSACRRDDCAPRMAVAVFRASGQCAAELRAALRDPARLKRAIEQADAGDENERRKAIRTIVTAEPLTGEKGARGFLLSLASSKGGRVAHGAALGRDAGKELRVVMAISDNRDAARDAAMRALAASP